MDFIKKQINETELIGMSAVLYGKQSENGQIIQKLWQLFNKRIWEIKNRLHDQEWVKYGLTYDSIPGKQYTYMAAVSVSSLNDIPDNMIGRHLPAMTMISTFHQGSLKNLKQTFYQLYNNWIPASNHKIASPEKFDLNHFEKYDKRFNWSSPDSMIEICIPLVDD